MQLTIVKSDNLVLIDNQAQTFDLSGYALPENLWALQWQNTSGEIEYTDKNNETIDVLPDWTTLIIAEHQSLAEEQKLQQEKTNQQTIYIINGQTRKNRISNQKEQQFQKKIVTLQYASKQILRDFNKRSSK